METFQSGQVIFRQGDPSLCAYLIEAGEVEVMDGHNGHAVRIARLGKGEIVGEMALIDERPRSRTVRAVGEVAVSAVSREQFVRLMFHDTAEGLRYLRAFFERLRTMNERFASLDCAEPADAPMLPADTPIRIIPLTVLAELALPAPGRVIERFPFRVGRESPKGASRLSMNDLGLPDSEPFNVSREHFAIDREGDTLVVYDRGSSLGTIVNGRQIGGHHTMGSAPLRKGTNEIIAGSPGSPFRFSVTAIPA